MPRKHEATEEELQAEWKRVQKYWDSLNKSPGGMMDYPWTRARFSLEVFKTMLRQRGWRVPSKLGGVGLP